MHVNGPECDIRPSKMPSHAVSVFVCRCCCVLCQQHDADTGLQPHQRRFRFAGDRHRRTARLPRRVSVVAVVIVEQLLCHMWRYDIAAAAVVVVVPLLLFLFLFQMLLLSSIGINRAFLEM